LKFESLELSRSPFFLYASLKQEAHMVNWVQCTEDGGTAILVNFDRATTIKTVSGTSENKNLTRVEFGGGHMIKIRDTEETILRAIGIREDAHRA
jgi:hypothetical protein